MARHATLADQYRAHREAFLLALELGCTPREAEQRLRDRAGTRRRACGTRAPEAPPAEGDNFEPIGGARDFGRWDSPWMMRD